MILLNSLGYRYIPKFTVYNSLRVDLVGSVTAQLIEPPEFRDFSMQRSEACGEDTYSMLLVCPEANIPM